MLIRKNPTAHYQRIFSVAVTLLLALAAGMSMAGSNNKERLQQLFGGATTNNPGEQPTPMPTLTQTPANPPNTPQLPPTDSRQSTGEAAGCHLGNHGPVRGRARIANGSLVAEDGCKLRALSLHMEDRDINWWRSAHDIGHFNAVRAMAYIGDWYDSGTSIIDIPGVEAVLDTMLANAKQTGMYLIIDNHSGKSQISRNRDQEFWNAIAERYKDDTNVIFELRNEPDMAFPPSTIPSYIDMLYHTVRSHAPNTMIITFSTVNIGGADWVSLAQQTSIDYSNAVFGFHPYGSSVSDVVNTVASFRQAGIGVVNSEVDRSEYLNIWRQVFEDNNIPYFLLAYGFCDSATGFCNASPPGLIDLNITWPQD